MFGFSIVALGFLTNEIWNLLQWLWWRGSYLELIDAPFYPGDGVRGVVHLSNSFSQPMTVQVCLTCQRTRDTRSKLLGHEVGETQTYYEVMFESRYLLDVEPANQRLSHVTEIPVCFPIPANAAESDDDRSLTWEVSLTWNKTRIGLSHRLEFDVPVFTAEDNSGTPRRRESFERTWLMDNQAWRVRQSHIENLSDLVAAAGGHFESTGRNQVDIQLPLDNQSRTIRWLGFTLAAMVFAGAEVVFGGWVGAMFALMPWLVISTTLAS